LGFVQELDAMATTKHVDEVRNQFSKQAEAYANTDQAKDTKAMEWLVSLLGTQSKDSVGLDVACGPGVLTCSLAKKCGEVIGFDATDELLKLARRSARREGINNVSFECGDIHDLEYVEAFDVITCRAAFHHFVRPESVASILAKALKQNGVLMVADTLSDEDKVKADAHNEIERLCDPSHVEALSKSKFDTIFSKCGLSIRRCIRSELSYDLDGWIDHGGPSAEKRVRIRELMINQVDRDTTGLNARIENGDVYFSHQTAFYLLEKAESTTDS
jgi:ubiquinone/menaquinone biosynthesis C-methylase UbiE